MNVIQKSKETKSPRQDTKNKSKSDTKGDHDKMNKLESPRFAKKPERTAEVLYLYSLVLS